MQINSDFEFLIKLVVIGDSGVGKTNFIFQFTEGRFSNVHVTTVGFDYKSKIIKLPNRKKVIKLQIWDTAGQERYMAINKNLFQKVQGIILMYDLSNRDSFEHVQSWINLIKKNVSNKVIMLVANKLDLALEKRIVTEEEGEDIGKKNDMLFFEGSGASGENVDKIFTKMAEEIYTKLIDERSEKGEYENKNLKLDKNKSEKKKCC
jgi:small GTP-binding protein